ncbi:MAG: endolytic transglycosylase MltG [Frankiales bacterium]|nr:endolytic transglycosylase MltG [Frankiales bacterium]
MKGLRSVERTIEDLPDDDHPLFGADDPSRFADAAGYVPGSRRRADRRRPKPRRGRRLAPFLAILVIVAVVGAGYVLVRQVTTRFAVADYTGNGQGFVKIQVQPGDGASDIAATLQKAGVVKSTRAFVNAATNSGQAGDIQPGVYQLRLRSSGSAAMTAILDPANRLVSKVTIPEGYTYLQVLQQIADKTKLPLAQLKAAAAQVANLGIPDGIKATSVEGMLFPATYDFDPNTTADSSLQSMITKFGAEYVALNMASKARTLGLTPYQVLIIASIAEAEAKFDADRAKVARVILNRIAIKRPLQVDATSAYAAKLQGKDPASVVYAAMPGPYNSYKNAGLPPTPIGNPGEAAINAALAPPPGQWLYYVNIDAAGHLGFFTDEASFLQAAATCKAKNWGCG